MPSIRICTRQRNDSCARRTNLCFRYAQSEPWILRNLSLRIEAGESVAIAGPSGCGKSTLAKRLLGLLEPTEGSVLLGGIDIRRYGLGNYRDVGAAVMQDDQLFAGSIADNICFFDPDATLERIQAAARTAALHDDIVAMPMTYESLVGDIESSLSGGQKQRVILARATLSQTEGSRSGRSDQPSGSGLRAPGEFRDRKIARHPDRDCAPA